MRKLLSLLLAFIMVCMICGAGVTAYADKRDDAVGVWKLTEITGKKDVMSREDVRNYEKLGVVMYMKFRDNGTVKFSLFDDVLEGTWDEYGMILDYAWMTYDVDDDKLTVYNQDGGELHFVRSSMDEIYDILGYKKGVLDEDVKYSTDTKKILDTDNAKVKITGYKADMTGFTVYLQCENKTRHEIVIGEDKCVLNKYIVHPNWSVSLDRRETLETEMKISPEDLERSGISSVDELILQMRVANGVNEKVIEKGLLAKVYPTGKKAVQVKAMTRKPVENEYRVYNNKACAYIMQGVDPEHEEGFAVNCYLENRSAGTLNFTWSDVTINGKPVSTDYEEAVLPGTLGYSDVVFPDTALMEQGIYNTNDITTIKGKVKVYDKTKSKPVLVVEKEFEYTP